MNILTDLKDSRIILNGNTNEDKKGYICVDRFSQFVVASEIKITVIISFHLI